MKLTGKKVAIGVTAGLASLCVVALLPAALVARVPTVAAQEKTAIKEDFEGAPKGKWVLEKGAALSKDQKHSGEQSLRLPPDGKATFTFSEENKFGTLSMWVYETGVKSGEQSGNGPLWGITNADEDAILVGCCWRRYLAGNSTYTWHYTANNFTWCYLGNKPQRNLGWHKWRFIYTNDIEGLILLYDEGENEVETAAQRHFKAFAAEFWKGGFNGLVIKGGSPKRIPDEKVFYFDDIEVELK